MIKTVEFYGVDFEVEYENIRPDEETGFNGDIEILWIWIGKKEPVDFFGFFHDANLIEKLKEKLIETPMPNYMGDPIVRNMFDYLNNLFEPIK